MAGDEEQRSPNSFFEITSNFAPGRTTVVTPLSETTQTSPPADTVDFPADLARYLHPHLPRLLGLPGAVVSSKVLAVIIDIHGGSCHEGG